MERSEARCKHGGTQVDGLPPATGLRWGRYMHLRALPGGNQVDGLIAGYKPALEQLYAPLCASGLEYFWNVAKHCANTAETRLTVYRRL